MAAGGGIYAPSAVHAAGTGTIEVCKSGANGMTGRSFTFNVAGYGSVNVTAGGCSAPLTVPAGNVRVTEAATSDTVVANIRTTPKSALVSSSLSTGTATLKVTAGGAEVIVHYVNRTPAAQLKVCKQADSNSTQLIGQPFSFSINGGSAFTLNAGANGSPNCSAITTYAAGTRVTVSELAPASNVYVSAIDVTQPPATNVSTDLNGRTATLTVGSGVNIVTYTNSIKVSATPGYLEICKQASDQFVSGNFSFSVTDAAGVSYGPFSVTVGQCTSPIQLASGPATITEAARAPFYLDYVYTSPSNRLISTNTTNGTARVSIVAGDSSNETVANFVNDTQQGQVKVCKTLSSNSSALAGSTFTFNYTSDAIGQGSISIVAAAPGQGACKFLPNLPIGSHISLTENGTPNVQLTGVSVSPGSNDNGSTSTTANITVGAGVTTATFNNMALGTIEVCKNAADAQTATQTFSFTVNGSINVNVHAGQCSMPITVPAGTATVYEQSKANFHLVSVTATGPSGDNRIVSGTNPVTVSSPFGGVGNETVVTFTNAVNTGQFKICKTSSDPNLQNHSFTFSYSASYDNTTVSGTTSLTPGTCSSLSAPIPVQDSTGATITVNVSEAATAFVAVTSITYQGNGALTASSTASGTASFTIGQGANVLTYDNEGTI